MPVPLSRMAISTLCRQIARRGGERRLVAAIRFRLLALCRCVKSVRNQVQQHPGDFLRHKAPPCRRSGRAISRSFTLKSGLFRPRAVIGEVQRLLDHRVDVDARPFARPLARMQQHVLDDRIGALAVADHLVEVGVDHADQLVGLLAVGLLQRRACRACSRSSSSSSRDSAEKLLTKLSGFLISWAMPAVSWPSEASFSDWTSRSCALRRSSSEAASSLRARLHLVEQAHVLERDDRLVGEGLDDLDLARRVKCPGSSRVSMMAPSTPSFLSNGTPSSERTLVAERRPSARHIRGRRGNRECARPCPKAARDPQWSRVPESQDDPSDIGRARSYARRRSCRDSEKHRRRARRSCPSARRRARRRR